MNRAMAILLAMVSLVMSGGIGSVRAGHCFSFKRYYLKDRGRNPAMVWRWAALGDRYFEFVYGWGDPDILEIREVSDDGDAVVASWPVPEATETSTGVCVSGGDAYIVADDGLWKVTGDGERDFIPWPWEGEGAVRCIGWHGVLVDKHSRAWHWDGTQWRVVYEAPEGWNLAYVVAGEDERWLGVVIRRGKWVGPKWRGVERYLLLDLQRGTTVEVGRDIDGSWLGIVGTDDPVLVFATFNPVERGQLVQSMEDISPTYRGLRIVGTDGADVCAEERLFSDYCWSDGELWLEGEEDGMPWVERVEVGGAVRGDPR